jgi:hypothetical protein
MKHTTLEFRCASISFREKRNATRKLLLWQRVWALMLLYTADGRCSVIPRSGPFINNIWATQNPNLFQVRIDSYYDMLDAGAFGPASEQNL